ncbi:hypothetical protein BDF19DRAFT_474614 [Syncephalis fuscata]|nr:hypothetical protein BDF19DRAFT_474614 [Syncephalis fuscata]
MLCQYILLATFSLSASAFSIPKSSTSPVPSILNNVKAAPQNNVLPNVLPNQLVFQSQLEPINKPIRLPPSAIEQVRLLGQFASVSSCDPTEWKCGLRCEGATAGTKLIDTFYHDRTGTFAYVAVNDEHRRIIVSFRGTVDVAAGAQDLRIIKTSISWLENKDAMVHTGFLSCYNSIRDNITETVKNTAQDYPEYTLTFWAIL